MGSRPGAEGRAFGTGCSVLARGVEGLNPGDADQCNKFHKGPILGLGQYINETNLKIKVRRSLWYAARGPGRGPTLAPKSYFALTKEDSRELSLEGF